MFFPSYLNQSPENNVSHVSLNINLNHGSTSPGDMVILVLSLKYWTKVGSPSKIKMEKSESKWSTYQGENLSKYTPPLHVRLASLQGSSGFN